MSNIIDFLETIGQDASLRYASTGEMKHMLADSQVDQDVMEAVLAKDQQRLSELLKAKNTCCVLMPSRVSCVLMSGMNDEDEGLGSAVPEAWNQTVDQGRHRQTFGPINQEEC